MPYQAKRPCTYPGCNVLTRTGRCENHPPTPRRTGKSPYDYRWTKLRNWYIAQNPVCEIRELCEGDAADEVDHIVPLADGGARLDPDNLQSACNACHDWKSKNVDGHTGHHERIDQ